MMLNGIVQREQMKFNVSHVIVVVFLNVISHRHVLLSIVYAMRYMIVISVRMNFSVVYRSQNVRQIVTAYY